MQRFSILVADDDPCIRQCLRKAIEIDPALNVVGEAENGLQALVLADQSRPDLVLLDAEMPRMDGLETARCLRQRMPEMCIVIMSVYEHLKPLAEEAGADAFIVKGSGCKYFRSMLSSAIMARTAGKHASEIAGEQ